MDCGSVDTASGSVDMARWTVAQWTQLDGLWLSGHSSRDCDSVDTAGDCGSVDTARGTVAQWTWLDGLWLSGHS